MDSSAQNRMQELLADLDVESKTIDGFASQLVWRIGRLNDDAPLTIRVGLASNTNLFSDLPKLRNASDLEIEEAVKTQNYRVEWIGQLPA